MMRIIGLIIVLVVLVFGLFLGVLNNSPIKMDYYVGTLELPLSLVLAFTLLLGAVLGAVSSIGIILKLKLEISRLRKKVRGSNIELTNLRNLSLKADH